MAMSATTKTATAGKPVHHATATSTSADTAAAEEFIALLESWRHADESEVQDQVETWTLLKQALDEDRPSYRKFFP